MSQKSFTKKQLLEAYPEILVAVQSGQIPYQENRLKSGFSSFKRGDAYTYFGLAILLFGIQIFAGFELSLSLGSVGLLAVGFVFLNNGQKYQLLARQFLAGTIQSSRPILATVPTNTDELAKLHGLLKTGALTQQEFDAEKKKILGKAS